jgi:phosphodiesterase/alkaline phosphatase D-like protein
MSTYRCWFTFQRAAVALLALILMVLSHPRELAGESAPTVETFAAFNVTYDSASLGGTINPNGLYTFYYFEWGTTVSYGHSTEQVAIGFEQSLFPQQSVINGLLRASTPYHFRIVATNSAGTSYGQDAVFTTQQLPSEGPLVITREASNITSNSARLNGVVNPNGRSTSFWYTYKADNNSGATLWPIPLGSGTSDIPLSFEITGLLPYTTYHFMYVASSGEVVIHGGDMIFTTLPGLAPPLAQTGYPSVVTTSSATLTAVVHPTGLNTTAYFRWGTTPAYGNVTATQSIGSGTSYVQVSSDLQGLLPDTTYYYQVVATNSLGTTFAEGRLFKTASLPPSPIAITEPATYITISSADLNATVNPNGLDTTVFFQWGTSLSYGNETSAIPIPPVFINWHVDFNLTGLVPNTLYHYRVVITSSGGTARGSDATFITLTGGAAPTVINLDPSNVTSNSATLYGAVNPKGLGTTAYFRWGTSTAYGNTTAAQTVGDGMVLLTVSVELTGLLPNTTYHYQIVASNSLGTSYGSNDRVFTTLAPGGARPIVATGLPTDITAHSARFTAYVNPNGSATTGFFVWGTATNEFQTAPRPFGDGLYNMSFPYTMLGLEPNTTYHYRVEATNSLGTASGANVYFDTLSNSSAPTIVNLYLPSNITPNSATLNDFVNPNSLETTVYIRWGTSTAYGNSTAPQLIGSGQIPVAVAQDLTGLSPDTTYHYQLVATNSMGSVSGRDIVFTTPPIDCPEKFLDLGTGSNGTLSSSSCRSIVKGTLWYADRYFFTVFAGTSVSISMTSSEIDTYVYLLKSGLVIASNDNGGGGTDSRIPPTTGFLALSEAGTYTIEVTSAAPGTSGNYLVHLGLPSGPLFSKDLSLLGGGAGSASTSGAGKSVRAGFATGTTSSNKGSEHDSSSTPYGTAIFSVTQNGVVVSEAGVPASTPSTRGRVFVDFQSNVGSKGIHQNAGEISINTGFAIVNPGNETAKIKFELRSSGAIVAQGNSTLPPNQHRALFLNELSQMAFDFILPSAFNGHGTLDILSDQPLSVVGLRLTTNQRGDTLITTTPIADLNQAPPKSTLYFPQFADGNGYKTMIILMNTSDMLEKGRLRIRNNQGEPLPVSAGGSAQSEIAYSILPGSLYVYLTDGAGDVVQAGSIQVVPDSSTSAPVGAGVLSYSVAGTLVAETGIPAATPTNHARVYVDRTLGHNTGLAIAAPDDTPIYVTLNAYPEDGSTPAGNGGCDLEGHGHEAKFANEFIPTLPDGFTGVLDISAPSPFVALTLRSLVNARGDFLLTTFPIADASQPAPNPLIFPQIADGGGYQTQFILISTGSGANATLNFFGDDGTPLAVGKSGR